ncbi:K+/H+ antiporter subunit F [Paracoccus laeviglucosivorans]|uniref:Multisubunit potassium/proton antiporter, PhaF subunit n=1 Tax=Paracoccus laeviglucosivorans TaxID=1197861 RepID=A0A521EXM4_9RHOB|nr:K+/H+ antiporter subunit F [Paracoccus laeviglucosivorans]SMO88655.1 multisubunit potassium/proton antiporter, PhaF subunit [Paracoccus laeviglucosivorans]
MIGYALAFAYGCFGVAMLCCLYRVLRGPAIGDRVIALDTLTVNAIALLALFGIDRGTGIYFEAALLFAMLGFVSTVAYAKFVLRGDIIE